MCYLSVIIPALYDLGLLKKKKSPPLVGPGEEGTLVQEHSHLRYQN